MLKAKKIKMNKNFLYSNDLCEISQIYLEGNSNNGYYYKEDIYDFLINNPNSIYVDVYPYPNLEPVLSKNGEKYVKSEANNYVNDNLLSLPRE